ncbi:MAG: thiamine-phosphate kinase [Bacteroidota bacterium]|nr:thiamine-phosphate kinase [Bacteroidota bacterium]
MPQQTQISKIGEFGLIEKIREIVGISIDDNLIKGISDDTAVYKCSPDKLQLLTTDAMVEGVHFDLTFTSMQHLGWKSIVSNISDIAAMGGVPRYAVITLCLPQKISVEMVEDLYRGVVQACKKYSCLVVGGDTTSATGNTVISISLTGEVDPEKIVYRSGAMVGDLICVTGHLGASHAGLKILLNEKNKYLNDTKNFKSNIEQYKTVLEKYLMPKPRLDISKILTQNIKVNSMIDISDGLASEVHHLCNNSGVGAEIWEHNIPVDSNSQRVAAEFSENIIDYALYGGEDYELLFTLTDSEFEKLEKLTSDVTILGRIVEQPKGINIIRESGERKLLGASGWDHFQSKKEQ